MLKSKIEKLRTYAKTDKGAESLLLVATFVLLAVYMWACFG